MGSPFRYRASRDPRRGGAVPAGLCLRHARLAAARAGVDDTWRSSPHAPHHDPRRHRPLRQLLAWLPRDRPAVFVLGARDSRPLVQPVDPRHPGRARVWPLLRVPLLRRRCVASLFSPGSVRADGNPGGVHPHPATDPHQTGPLRHRYRWPHRRLRRARSRC